MKIDERLCWGFDGNEDDVVKVVGEEF